MHQYLEGPGYAFKDSHRLFHPTIPSTIQIQDTENQEHRLLFDVLVETTCFRRGSRYLLRKNITP